MVSKYISRRNLPKSQDLYQQLDKICLKDEIYIMDGKLYMTHTIVMKILIKIFNNIIKKI